MKDPHTSVIGHKTNNKIALRWQYESVSSHRVSRESRVVGWIIWNRITVQQAVKVLSVSGCSSEKLEVVPMEVEWTGTGVAIAENNIHNLVVI